MERPKQQKLKYVLDHVPPGFLVDSRWLAQNDIAKSSAHDYQRANWLERVTRGVYRRPYATSETSDPKDWKIPVLSAQWIMGYDFHVGASTALGLLGHSHYLSLGREDDVYLFGDAPNWLPKLLLAPALVTRTRQLFGGSTTGVENRTFDPFADDGASPWRWPLKASCPERAILEALNELPGRESFHKLDMAFDGMGNLRPRRLTELLAECRSIKVKRLFFLFAERHDHGWLRHIDRAQVDLGSGPRSLVEGGKLHPTYQLVVPPEFARPGPRGNDDGA